MASETVIAEELVEEVAVDKGSEEQAEDEMAETSQHPKDLSADVQGEHSQEQGEKLVEKCHMQLAENAADKCPEEVNEDTGTPPAELADNKDVDQLVGEEADRYEELTEKLGNKHSKELQPSDETVNTHHANMAEALVSTHEEGPLQELLHKHPEEMQPVIVVNTHYEDPDEELVNKHSADLQPAEEVGKTYCEELAENVIKKHHEGPAEEVVNTQHEGPAEEVANTPQEEPAKEVVNTPQEEPAEEVVNTQHEELAEVVNTPQEEPAEEVVNTPQEEPAEEVVNTQHEELAEVVNTPQEEPAEEVVNTQHEKPAEYELQLKEAVNTQYEEPAEEVANTHNEELAEDAVSTPYEKTAEEELETKHPEELQLAQEVVNECYEEPAEEVVNEHYEEPAEGVVNTNPEDLADEAETKHSEEMQPAEEMVKTHKEEPAEDVVNTPHEEQAVEVVRTAHELPAEDVADKQPVQQVEEKSLEEMACVEIDAEEFSIIKKPPSTTTLVARQRNYLLGSINLPVLVEDLGRVGKFVRVAYNGVAGHIELQIQIREIGYDVTKLCDKSAITVSRFKQASGSILDDLQGTYQFLLGGMEDIAVVTLTSVIDVAKDMASAAEKLHKEFEKESLKVESALTHTMREKGREEKRAKEIRESNKKYEADKNHAEERRKASEEEYTKSELKYEGAEIKQEKAQAYAKSPVKALINAFTSPVGFKMFPVEAQKQSAQESYEEKLKHLEDMQKQRALRRQAIQDIAEFAKKIKDCSDDEELATVAIDALHQAMGGLQKLSLVMLKIATFWKQLQMHCETLTKDKMKRMVMAAMEMPKEERLHTWTATGFKRQAIAYYAQWVALDDVCEVFMAKIMETQGSLHGYLTENPTVEEARANVHQLAVTFVEDLKRAQDEIDRKDADDEKERIRLCAAESTAV